MVEMFFFLLFRPVAGSLTEARGQKANIHVIREMLQLCEIIDTGGEEYCEDTPGLKVMFFGELFDVRLTRAFPLNQI